jgi:chemotaxis protein histidine kinase CheA
VELIFEAGLSTASAVDSISGRGQGMAIAQERMRAMEGELAVETWPGAGTRFTLSFPDPLPEKAALAESPARRMPITA